MYSLRPGLGHWASCAFSRHGHGAPPGRSRNRQGRPVCASSLRGGAFTRPPGGALPPDAGVPRVRDLEREKLMTDNSGELALTTRNAPVEDLVALLRGQQARKVDVVAPASAIRATDGLPGAGRHRPAADRRRGDDDGRGLPADGRVRSGDRRQARYPSSLPAADADVTRRLFDANVNGWLAGDDRSFFVRCLRGNDGQAGVARAWLSDGYKPIDHLDTLMAVFDGIRAAGHPVPIDSCDLTERRMYVRVRCEAVQVLAPALLSGYRSPFSGAPRRGQPGGVRRVRGGQLRDRLRRVPPSPRDWSPRCAPTG